MESASTNIHNHFCEDLITITNSQPQYTGTKIIRPGTKETIYFHSNRTELATILTIHSEALRDKTINIMLPYPPQKDISIMKYTNAYEYSFIKIMCDNKCYATYSSQ
jgi:hypothetical protein